MSVYNIKMSNLTNKRNAVLSDVTNKEMSELEKYAVSSV